MNDRGQELAKVFESAGKGLGLEFSYPWDAINPTEQELMRAVATLLIQQGWRGTAE